MHTQVEVLCQGVGVGDERTAHRTWGLSRGDGKCGISFEWNINVNSFLYNCDTKDIKFVEILF